MTHPLWDEADLWLARAKQLHLEFAELMSRVTSITQRQELTDSDSVDVGWMISKCAEVFDEMKKDANARKHLIGRLLAGKAALRIRSGEDVSSIRGRVAIAVPTVKHVPKVPAPGTPEYELILRKWGIPDELIKRELLKIRYEQAAEVLAEYEACGEAPPPGLVSAAVEAQVTFRQR